MQDSEVAVCLTLQQGFFGSVPEIALSAAISRSVRIASQCASRLVWKRITASSHGSKQAASPITGSPATKISSTCVGSGDDSDPPLSKALMSFVGSCVGKAMEAFGGEVDKRFEHVLEEQMQNTDAVQRIQKDLAELQKQQIEDAQKTEGH